MDGRASQPVQHLSQRALLAGRLFGRDQIDLVKHRKQRFADTGHVLQDVPLFRVQRRIATGDKNEKVDFVEKNPRRLRIRPHDGAETGRVDKPEARP